MTDEEKKALQKLKETSKQCHNSKECWENEDCCDCYVEIEDILAIDTVLNLIEKQSKVIDEMIKHIERTCYYQDDYSNSCDIIQDTCVKLDKNCKECIKQYFYRKVEEK